MKTRKTPSQTVVSLTVPPSVRDALARAADADGVTLAAWMQRATEAALALLDALAPDRFAADFAGVAPGRLAAVLARAGRTPEEEAADARRWPMLARPGFDWIEPAAWTEEAPAATVAFRLAPGLARRAAAAAALHGKPRDSLLAWAARLSLVGRAPGGRVQREQ